MCEHKALIFKPLIYKAYEVIIKILSNRMHHSNDEEE